MITEDIAEMISLIGTYAARAAQAAQPASDLDTAWEQA